MNNCLFKDCPNNARWTPVLLLYPPRTFAQFAERAESEVLVCDEHKDELNIGMLLTDGTWQNIVSSYLKRGITIPVRESTELVFEMVQ